MKEENIDKILNNLSDSEKFRLLYRLELVELNKKLSAVLAKSGVKGEEFSSARRKLYHNFFDNSGENAGNYKQMEIRLANLSGSVIEYFDAKTMFAYALFTEVITKEFFKNMNLKVTVDYAKEVLAKYFKTEELKFKDRPVKFDVAKLSPEQKKLLEERLMEYFNIGELFYNLYYDGEVEKEIRNKANGGNENF